VSITVSRPAGPGGVLFNKVPSSIDVNSDRRLMPEPASSCEDQSATTQWLNLPLLDSVGEHVHPVGRLDGRSL
jgi:hypothetical protein